MHAPIDIELLHAVIHDEYGMRILNAGPYSSLLNVYRDIDKINSFLFSDREATEEYILLLCRKLGNDACFASEIIKWTLEYRYGDISKDEYQEWYNSFVEHLSENGVIYRMNVSE